MLEKVHPYYFSFLKVFFDYLFAIIIFILIFPILFLIGLTIFISAGYPVIFIQKRMGKDGKTFQMYKFRTMYRGAHLEQDKYKSLNKAPGPMFKIFDDPRFVGIGRILSRTGLDELPQIINILKGEMSFIGPRPLPVSEAKQLSQAWSFRHLVKPGIFSEWTFADNRYNSLADWRELDRKTLSNGGIKYDLKLIFFTLIKSFTYFKK
ncbi:sugar transferase [Candidatus Pacearchaeota archaeon]|nr:sugar transferase [Candidatus Pacearchaeota archaeon]